MQVVLRESGRELFSVTTFAGDQVPCPRSGLVRICQSRYTTICQKLHQHQTRQASERQAKPEELPEATPDSADSQMNSTTGSSSTELGHCSPEREERGTCTEPLLTEERGVGVQVCTQEKAVGTGPLMVDKSTGIPREPLPPAGAEVPEESWVGHTVIARRDSDGVYYPGIPSTIHPLYVDV